MLIENFAKALYDVANKDGLGLDSKYKRAAIIADVIASLALTTLGALAIAGILPFSATVAGALVGGGILYILSNIALRCNKNAYTCAHRS